MGLEQGLLKLAIKDYWSNMPSFGWWLLSRCVFKDYGDPNSLALRLTLSSTHYQSLLTEHQHSGKYLCMATILTRKSFNTFWTKNWDTSVLRGALFSSGMYMHSMYTARALFAYIILSMFKVASFSDLAGCTTITLTLDHLLILGSQLNPTAAQQYVCIKTPQLWVLYFLD